MKSQEITINNISGVHARPAATFVKMANQFRSNIYIEKNETRINGKSIMGLMMLALTRGTKIKIIAEGEDEETAVSSLITLIQNDFKHN